MVGWADSVFVLRRLALFVFFRLPNGAKVYAMEYRFWVAIRQPEMGQRMVDAARGAGACPCSW